MIGVEAGSVQSNSGSSGSLSLRGIGEVFYAPSRFFAELKNNPKILVPYLAFAAVTFILLMLVADYIMEASKQTAQYQRQLEMMGGQMPPGAEALQRYSITIGGTVAFMLSPLLAAALALFWGNFVFAGTARFRQLLSVMLYGELLFIIGDLFVVPLVMLKKSIFVSISLAVLLPNPNLESIPYLALSKISLFHIWEIIVIGIGLSIIYGFSRNKGYLLAVLSMGLLSILHVVSSYIGSLFV